MEGRLWIVRPGMIVKLLLPPARRSVDALFGYPSANCSSAEPASVLPNGINHKRRPPSCKAVLSGIGQTVGCQNPVHPV